MSNCLAFRYDPGSYKVRRLSCRSSEKRTRKLTRPGCRRGPSRVERLADAIRIRMGWIDHSQPRSAALRVSFQEREIRMKAFALDGRFTFAAECRSRGVSVSCSRADGAARALSASGRVFRPRAVFVVASARLRVALTRCFFAFRSRPVGRLLSAAGARGVAFYNVAASKDLRRWGRGIFCCAISEHPGRLLTMPVLRRFRIGFDTLTNNERCSGGDG